MRFLYLAVVEKLTGEPTAPVIWRVAQHAVNYATLPRIWTRSYPGVHEPIVIGDRNLSADERDQIPVRSRSNAATIERR